MVTKQSDEVLKTPIHAAMQEVSGLNSEGIEVKGGKKYTQVVTRVEVFRKHFGVQFAIRTTVSEFMSGVAAKAIIFDQNDREIATGHAFTTSIAKEKSIEKLETTAVGRALAALGLSGGEYATQDEIETHEERYEKPPREQKIRERDIAYELSLCRTIEELEAFEEIYQDELLPDFIKDGLENRKKGAGNNVVFPSPKYGFIDVEEALAFGTIAKKNIEEGPIDGLEEWIGENDAKIKGLDSMLRAAKYNKDGTPSGRLFKAYDKRIKLMEAAE